MPVVLAGGPLLVVAAKRIDCGIMSIPQQLIFVVGVTFRGGLGGAETRRLFAEIDRRIAGLLIHR